MAAIAEDDALIILAGVPEINQVLTLCGFTNPVDRARLVQIEQFDTLDSFGDFSDDSIEHMARKYERPGPDQMRFGITRLVKMKAIAYWVRKQRREGLAATIDRLNNAVLAGTIREMTISTEEAKKDEKMFYPEKFNPKKYISWMQSFENYLDSVQGKSKVPLTYIIRPEGVNPADAVDQYQRAIWSAPHVGYAFQEDNRLVYRIYKDVMVDTDGWTWFNRAGNGNGRQAHQIITTHYSGTAETARRAAEAEAMLERLHYKSEASFTFERYVTKMNECFELMKDNDQDLAEAQKVKKLLNGVKSNHTEVNALKTVVRTNHPTDFNAATTLMAGQIAVLFPAASISYEQRPKRKISAANTRGGRGRFGQKQGQTPVIANGVDISNPNRSFTSDEWQRLRQSGLLSWILEHRNNHGRQQQGRGGRGNGGRGNHFQGGRGGNQDGRGNGGGRNIAAVEHHQQTNGNVPANPQSELTGRGGRTGVHFGGGCYGAGRGRE
jgi:hypothetical protein